MADLDRGRMKGKKARDIESLFKKAKELSILCGILVSIIIFSPQEEIPIMWPNERECTAILTRYVGFSEKERRKKLVQHEDYLMDKLTSRKRRIEEKWRKILQNKEEREMKIIFEQLLDGKVNLSERNLDAGKIRELLKLSALARIKVNERKEQLNRQFQTSQPSSLFPNFNPIMVLDQNRYFCADRAASTSLVGENRGKRKLIEQTSQPSWLFPNFNPIMVEINNIDQNRCFCVDGATSTSWVGDNRDKRKLIEDRHDESK